MWSLRKSAVNSSDNLTPPNEVSHDHSAPTVVAKIQDIDPKKLHQRNRSHDSGLLGRLKNLLGWQSLDVADNTTKLDESFNKEQKQNVWQLVSGLIGTDPVSLISLPVWVFEPTTFLTRMAEPMYFSNQFFDVVAKSTDPIERLAQIAAFNVACLCFTQRNLKPFNPYLGETYEYTNDKITFVAEQVSHHPPISAGVTRSVTGDWICHQEVHVKTKFWGNYVEIYPLGNTHVYFPKTGDHFYWPQPNLCLHNVIVGGMWYDYYGTIEIVNEKGDGEKAKLIFHRCGMFSRGSYRKVTGEIYDKDGNVRMQLQGNWNKKLTGIKIDQDGKKGEKIVLWRKNEELIDHGSNKWRIANFVQKQLEITPDLEKILPPTDSRLRSDRRYLAANDYDASGKEKTLLERHHRQLRADREKEGITWSPKYFKKVDGDGVLQCNWQYNGGYWEERNERVKTLGLPDTYLTPETTSSTS